MGAVVRIPGPLRRVTQNRDRVEVQGSTLAQAIDELEGHFPGLSERLLDDGGELKHFVNVYVNGEDVQFLDGLQTAIKGGDEVSIVPAVAGGDGPPHP